MGDHRITIRLEGLPGDEGHVRLSALLERMEALQSALNAISRSVTPGARASLYYRVVSATHSSPLELTIEPIDRTDRIQSSIARETHCRFFFEMENLRRGQPLSEFLDNDAAEKLTTLVEWDPDKISSMAFRNGTSAIKVTEEVKQNARRYLSEEETSWGQLEGYLEGVNFHGKDKRFYIYPPSGPARGIRCTFVAGLKRLVKESLERRVVVVGKKHFRQNQKFPHAIDVRELEVLESPSKEEHLAFIDGEIDDDRDAVDVIREMRDEW